MMWEYRAMLVRVIDGDTIVAELDQGLSGRQEEPLRLEAASAPERSELGGPECTAFTGSWLAVTEYSGRRWPLRVVTIPNTKREPDERKSIVRYLAQVTDFETGESLNADLREFVARHPEWGTGL